MQSQNKVLDDVARLANNAAGVFSGVRDEIDTAFRQKLERVLMDMDLVSRDEFEAIKAVARKAREEQEVLSAKVDELESELAAVKKKPARKTTKPAAK